MAREIEMAAQLISQTMRVGWYYGLSRLMQQRAQQYGPLPPVQATLPVPTFQELMADLGRLLMEDAAAVRQGLYPPSEDDTGWREHFARVREMMADLPEAVGRRRSRDGHSARAMAAAEGLPDYFAQNFHYQTGGYLTEESARLYDVQVDTLFMGSANAMRRQALKPVLEHIRGRDQRQVRLLDVACGTGRFLRQLRLACPAIPATGIDLSEPYLDEARRHLAGLRPVTLVAANAEALPVPAASQDVVVSIFLYHELPGEVRRRVTAEIARVLKPGGLYVFMDSLQLGDRPGWDGILETFPQRFHEPYYRHYIADDLEGMFSAAGLERTETRPVFLSKLMVRGKG